MVKKILLGVVVLIAAFLGYVATLPSEFKVGREATINATPAAIFPHVNSTRKMDAWNPWMKVDPQVKITYSGPETGVGSMSTWEGNNDIGAGSATIVESVPNQLVRTRLDFLKPFAGTSMVEFTLKAEGTQTVVSWSNSGKSQFIPRIFCTLMRVNMDKMMGEMFEKGLADLKGRVEAEKH